MAKSVIMLSSNDYLGLTTHSKVIEAGNCALEILGGLAQQVLDFLMVHVPVMKNWKNFSLISLAKKPVRFSPLAHLGCMASVSSFINKDDLVLVDRNVHSSLWSGINLTRAHVERFGHNDPDDLRDVLRKEDESQPKFLDYRGSIFYGKAILLGYLSSLT